MEKQHFPKWKYNKKHPARTVANVEEEEALGDEWVDSPADLSEDAEEPEANEETTRRGNNKRK